MNIVVAVNNNLFLRFEFISHIGFADKEEKEKGEEKKKKMSVMMLVMAVMLKVDG